ncbi:putative lipoate protein ligase [Bifidobacterium gallicum DSM 20093 = LMG 11596]|nr:putative lipoate protein ligase [Bifidobacterium gallicum DSM 20093 = LMG 11596]
MVGGKMVRVHVVDQGDACDVRIDGDYFLSREPQGSGDDPIVLIQRALERVRTELGADGTGDGSASEGNAGDCDELRACVRQAVQQILDDASLPQLIGVDAQTIVQAFVTACGWERGVHGVTREKIGKRAEHQGDAAEEVTGSVAGVSGVSGGTRVSGAETAVAGDKTGGLDDAAGEPQCSAAVTARGTGESGDAAEGVGDATGMPGDEAEELDEVTVGRYWRELGEQGIEIIVDGARGAAEQMLEEERQVELVARDGRPRLRFWRWGERAVVIGRFQSVRNEVNEQAAQQLGFAVVRRGTGGGAMLVEPDATITYSLVTPLEWSEGLTPEQTFRVCDAFAVAALNSIGMRAMFTGLNDIASPRGKIGGAAERKYPARQQTQENRAVEETLEAPGERGMGVGRNAVQDLRTGLQLAADGGFVQRQPGRHGVLLHHTTLAYDFDGELMSQVLHTAQAKLVDKAVQSAKRRVDPIVTQTTLSREDVQDALVQCARDMARGDVGVE